MALFTVYVSSEVVYSKVVEAKDAEEAEAKVLEDDGDGWDLHNESGWSVDCVEPV